MLLLFSISVAELNDQRESLLICVRASIPFGFEGGMWYLIV